MRDMYVMCLVDWELAVQDFERMVPPQYNEYVVLYEGDEYIEAIEYYRGNTSSLEAAYEETLRPRLSEEDRQTFDYIFGRLFWNNLRPRPEGELPECLSRTPKELREAVEAWDSAPVDRLQAAIEAALAENVSLMGLEEPGAYLRSVEGWVRLARMAVEWRMGMVIGVRT